MEKLGQTLERAAWLGASAVLLHPGQLGGDALRPRLGVDAGGPAGGGAPGRAPRGDAGHRERVEQVPAQPAGDAWLDEGHPRIGAYFDVGNCILYGYPEQWVGILGERIKKVHVKDFKRSVATGAGFCQLPGGRRARR